MSLEIFDTGELKIIANMKYEGKENFILTYPGLLSVLPDGKNGLKAIIVPMIVPFVKNHHELLEKFMLHRSKVIYHGPAIRDFEATYKKFREDLARSVSGIIIPEKGIKLPKFLGGRR